MMETFGYPAAQWEAAKREATSILAEHARRGIDITYSELVAKLKSIHLDARDPALSHLLGQVARDEDSAGRGMLSVFVVHGSGDRQPGPGFFDLAKQLGRNTSNVTKCWLSERDKVHAYWALKVSILAPATRTPRL
jgi:hypothetical protein